MREKASSVSILQDADLNAAMENSDAMLVDTSSYSGLRVWSIPALKHHLKLYFSTAVSGNYDQTWAEAAEIAGNIKKTGEIGNNHWDIAQQYLEFDGIACHEINGTYFLFKK